MSVPKGEIVARNFMEKMTKLKKIDELAIFSLKEFYQLFDGKPCHSLSVAKA